MDRRLPSPLPPAGIAVEQAPLFVTMGFDDNGHSGLVDPALCEGMRWVSEFFAGLRNPDGSAGSCTFYHAGHYITEAQEEPVALVHQSWLQAIEAGHGLGCHTQNHRHGREFSAAEWCAELNEVMDRFTAPVAEGGLGVAREAVVGFRTPFLEYNDNTFATIVQMGFHYDCSIEEGFQPDQDGTNFLWPYTLDEGSPGNRWSVAEDDAKPVGSHAGLWEMPSHCVIAPPDELCEQYGIPVGFREKLYALHDWFNPADGKITGLDYNCVVLFAMTAPEWLATLKYTFDLRRKGNRAPMLFGGHSDVYATGYDWAPNITIADRREVIETFFSYVLQFPEVRVDSVEKVLQWMRNPQPLEC